MLIGATGSGKTVALKYLDNAYTRLFPTMRHYVLDSKMDGDFDDWPGVVQSDLCPPRPGRNQRYQVWQPVSLIPEQIERWLYGILKDPPAVVEIDELVHLVYKPGLYSEMYNRILKTGRSLPVGSITLTQELGKIPGNAYKQSKHRLGFYIDKAAEYDRRVRNNLLKAKVDDPPDPYGLYYQHRSGRGDPRYYSSIQEFLGLS